MVDRITNVMVIKNIAQCLVCSSINSCYNYYEILIKHALIKIDLLLSYQIYAVSLNIILQLAPGI